MLFDRNYLIKSGLILDSEAPLIQLIWYLATLVDCMPTLASLYSLYCELEKPAEVHRMVVEKDTDIDGREGSHNKCSEHLVVGCTRCYC